MTKHPTLHEEALKEPLGIEDAKIIEVPKMIDDSLIATTPNICQKPKNKMKVGIDKPKAQAKRTSRLCKATQYLYDLEEAHGPEKVLNLNLDLYQMEDY